MKTYNKLVRDKIPEVIKRKGGKPKFHIASDDEYWAKLKEKLKEEVDEFINAESAEELADILEVIDAIIVCARSGRFDEKDVVDTQIKKAKERGRFKKRIILEES